ncbi:hypothetical protein KK062_29110 [Fulvivirgaceae bacterium PWU5]|uniref:Uncharacterized protein n=1 Tax=Dawidia cretensis TaxID=2782350 RepID=A0AAP2E4V6_9BACT|nr:hypothetical protein [Dawidia cretensis]MBT1712338.1 hypothetical protein [Dawidia cretensis]
MAFLEELKITGNLGDLSFYHMQGVDKIVVRRKGGASKDHIRNSPAFATPRLYMSEFGGCSKMGKEVRFMLHPMKAMADYNFSGFINKALKAVQKLDGNSDLGRRAITLSKYPSLLTGFSLNKYTTFDSVVRTPVMYAIDREKRSAQVNIPRLLRDINFFPNNKHTRFRMVVCLGIVPDFTFNPVKGKYEPPAWYDSRYDAETVYSPWYAALKGSPEATLNLTADQVPPDDSYSLMLTIGVQFGSPMEDDVVAPVKRAGAAKILGIAGVNGGTDGESLSVPLNAEHEEIGIPSEAAHTRPEMEAVADDPDEGPSISSRYCMKYVPASASTGTRVYTYAMDVPAKQEIASAEIVEAVYETTGSAASKVLPASSAGSIPAALMTIRRCAVVRLMVRKV